jgi:RNA polymerase sigma-70 factor, ECF subfamily
MMARDQSDREERFIALYRAHQPKIVAYARRRLPDPDAADAVADTFLAAWRQLDQLPPEPLPWLYRIAWHAVANQRRRSGRWLRLQSRAHVRLRPGAGPDPAVAADSSNALAAA